jgi:hypothetical protein
MLFLRRPPDPLLGRRLGGLTASAALHATAVLLATWTPDSRPAVGGQASVAASAGRSPVIAVVPSDADAGAQPDTLPRRPSLELAGITVDLEKVGGTPAELFPFVQLQPLAPVELAEREQDTRRLPNPLLRGPGPSVRPPLRITDRELQALVDRAWSRRERWQPFAPIMAMATASDGDHGRAADLLRAYTGQNLLQPYYDGDTLDARYWTMLGLAADHRVFLEHVTEYLRQRARTKVSVELLFLLDELVQGSRDTLLMVTGNDPAAALRRSAAEQPEAYARAQRLFADTRTWLKAQGLNEPDAIRRRLDDVRLHVLALIVDLAPEGYRAADARYLAGVILFEQRQRDRAAAEWSRAVPGPFDLYADALVDVRAALVLPPDRRVAAVVAALGAEHGRWLDFSERRLRRFGFRGTAF